MRRLALGAILTALAIHAGPAAAADGLTVRASFSPEVAFFGDTVTARVDVLVDRTKIDEGSPVVDASFGSWTETARTRSEVASSATIVRRTWWYSISCLTFACVPKSSVVQDFSLPALRVTARDRNGTTQRVTMRWPALRISGRFTPPPNSNVTPLFDVTTDVPAPTYRVDPSALSLGLDVGGGLLLAIAAGCAGYAVHRRRVAHRGTSASGTPLARALALVRDSRGRSVEDRRRAAGLLARTLPPQDGRLASAASRVAWSVAEPTPDALERLLQTVETETEPKR